MKRKKQRKILDPFFSDPEDTFLKTERHKARELRKSQWWKRKLAKGICHYCGKQVAPADLTMDHIVPLSRGGRSSKGNVVTACKTCNTKKKYLLPFEWEDYLNNLRSSSFPTNSG